MKRTRLTGLFAAGVLAPSLGTAGAAVASQTDLGASRVFLAQAEGRIPSDA